MEQDTAVAAYVAERGIQQLVHFTPRENIFSMFLMGALLSKPELLKEMQARESEAHLSDIVSFQDSLRYETIPCLNLSIQTLNSRLFHNFQARKAAIENWDILLLDPALMADKGVRFSATNAGTRIERAIGYPEGIEGLKRLFAEKVQTAHGTLTRAANRAKNLPTDEQAEVLYPTRIPVTAIRGIVSATAAKSQDLQASLRVILSMNGHSDAILNQIHFSADELAV